MRESDTTFPVELRSTVAKNMVAASRLVSTQFRLDAPAFLSGDEFAAFMEGASESQPLSQLAEVFTVYIQSPVLAYVRPFKDSRPYMTTSELAEYQTGHTTHVSLLADPRLLQWGIKHRSIVVSRSGRVGEAYWVDKNLAGALVGDSFRVVPNKAVDGPFLYAVLASRFARNFLSGSAYGSVIDHASVDQLRNFPIPKLTGSVKSRITASMGKALAARERANALLYQAQTEFLKANDLQQLNVSLADALSARADVVNFTVLRSDLMQSSAGASEFRLEAHFHNPTASAAVKSIRACPSETKSLDEIAKDVILGARFKRNYVETSFGTPFLSGRSIIQIHPEVKYLSNSETENLDEMLVKRGWILVTCSGTIGRTCLVWKNFEGYASSQHILRVLPNEDKVDPGYLYAFLSSEYGYQQIVRFRHGSVIDEITDQQLKKVIIPLPSSDRQLEIGDLVRRAFEKRSESLRLEDEAQKLLLHGIKSDRTREQ